MNAGVISRFNISKEILTLQMRRALCGGNGDILAEIPAIGQLVGRIRENSEGRILWKTENIPYRRQYG